MDDMQRQPMIFRFRVCLILFRKRRRRRKDREESISSLTELESWRRRRRRREVDRHERSTDHILWYELSTWLDTYRPRQFESQWESSWAHPPQKSPQASRLDSRPISSARQLQTRARSHSLSRLPSPRCLTSFWAHRKSCSRQSRRSAYSQEGAPRLCARRWTTPDRHSPSVVGPLALRRGGERVRRVVDDGQRQRYRHHRSSDGWERQHFMWDGPARRHLGPISVSDWEIVVIIISFRFSSLPRV